MSAVAIAPFNIFNRWVTCVEDIGDMNIPIALVWRAAAAIALLLSSTSCGAEQIVDEDSILPKRQSLEEMLKFKASPVTSPPRDLKTESLSDYYSRNNMKLHKPRLNLALPKGQSLRYNVNTSILEYQYNIDDKFQNKSLFLKHTPETRLLFMFQYRYD